MVHWVDAVSTRWLASAHLIPERKHSDDDQSDDDQSDDDQSERSSEELRLVDSFLPSAELYIAPSALAH